MEHRKAAIMQALDRFVAQRPGLEFGNYGDVKAYRSEMRRITRDRHDYQRLARAVEHTDSITADDIIGAAGRVFSGRLSIYIHAAFKTSTKPIVSVDYVAGQHFPTEYRKAACAVMMSVLWAHTRKNCMPSPVLVAGPDEYAGARPHEQYGPKKQSAGDWLRAYFRREFGRSVANRWFF